jgi:hypothetical protein
MRILSKDKLQNEIRKKQHDNNVQTQAAERGKDKQHDKYRIRSAEHRNEK